MKANGKPQIAVGLDAGSGITRCLICATEDGRMRYLGRGEVESRGWQKGRIADPHALSFSIQAAVQQAEKEAGVMVESVVAGIGGASIEGGTNRGVYECGRTPRPISQSELSFAADRASQGPSRRRPHAAACLPAGFYRRRTLRLSQPARHDLLPPGSERLHPNRRFARS